MILVKKLLKCSKLTSKDDKKCNNKAASILAQHLCLRCDVYSDLYLCVISKYWRINGILKKSFLLIGF